MKKRMIWSNMDLNIDDWRDSYKEHLELNCLVGDPDNESEIYAWMEDENNEYLYDEKVNLNKEIDGRILIIADLGLWDGRKSGYKILGNNVNEIFNINNRGWDFAEFYGDGYNIKGTEWHHDGTNYYEYRVIRENRNIESLLNAIYNGEEISRKKMNYYTKSLYPYVAQIYGWR